MSATTIPMAAVAKRRFDIEPPVECSRVYPDSFGRLCITMRSLTVISEADMRVILAGGVGVVAAFALVTSVQATQTGAVVASGRPALSPRLRPGPAKRYTRERARAATAGP
jgi:hypothetical protein